MESILKFAAFLVKAFFFSVLNALLMASILQYYGTESWLLLFIIFLLTFSLPFFLFYVLCKGINRTLAKKNRIFSYRITKFVVTLILTECAWLLVCLLDLYDTKNDVSPAFTIVDLIWLLSMSFLFLLDFIWESLSPKRTPIQRPLDDLENED